MISTDAGVRNGLKLTFGMHLDGVPASEKQASFGEFATGPLGMLSLLEPRLGLSGPSIHPAHRINQYMERLKLCDRPAAWFHDSFSADAWSTAKKLLELRDSLIEAGWNGKADKTCSVRLQSLSEVEQSGLALSPGAADRLIELLKNLDQSAASTIASVQLVDEFDLLPPTWQKFFKKLKGFGIIVEKHPVLPNSGVSSNLSIIREAMSSSGTGGNISDKDDSILLLKASDEWEAAESLATWLAADTKSKKDITIICDGDSDILDQALQRLGLPQLGGSEASRWRSALQILPLVLANSWNPLDLHSIVELLSLSISPVPKYVARRLFKALGEEPGIGGDKWKEAFKELCEKKKGCLIDDGILESEAKTRADSYMAELDAFLSKERFDPEEGIPEEALKRRCQWVKEFAAGQLGREPMLMEVLAHAKEMQSLADGKGYVPRVTVERMLDSVIGTGCESPDRQEQAAAWKVVKHPGQIISMAKTVLWWGFKYPADAQPLFWSDSERDSLKRLGADMESSSAIRRREVLAWRRAIDNAQENLLIFHPVQLHGEDSPHHPLWDDIFSVAMKAQTAVASKHAPKDEEDLSSCLTRKCASLNQKESWTLAGHKVSLRKIKEKEPKKAVARHSVPKNSFAPPASHSYSQMSTMIGCPMKWTLHYHSGLRKSESFSLPTGNQMIGTFCHRIVQELFNDPGASFTPADAEKKAAVLFDKLLPAMASELLLDGRSIDCQRYRTEIIRAIGQLVAAVNRLGLTVDETEKELAGDMDGITFKGYSDLVLHDRDGDPFILDLKWSNSSKRKMQEVKEGDSLQLAVYAWLLRSGKSSKVHAGYFMLVQGELLSDSELLKDEAIESDLSLDEIWQMGKKSWTHNLKSLNEGTIEVGGIIEENMKVEENLSDAKEAKDKIKKIMKDKYRAEGMLYQEPPCFFCDFGNLCGMIGGDR